MTANGLGSRTQARTLAREEGRLINLEAASNPLCGNLQGKAYLSTVDEGVGEQ